MGQDSTCPCCGAPDETQSHIFQCNNPDVQRTMTTSLNSFKLYLQQHKLPMQLIECAVELCNSFFHRTTPSIRHTSQLTKTLIQQQLHRGHELFLRGFISSAWLDALVSLKTQQPKTKIKHILHGLWHHIMLPIWDQRNAIHHNNDNIVTQHAHKQADSELTDWKILSAQRLHPAQQHLTHYSSSDFKSWTLQHKHNVLHILQLAHKNYKQFLKDDISSGRQPLISEFTVNPT